MQCGLIPVDEQVVNVETLPVGLSMMSADSIVNPRGMNIWDFLVVKLRLGLAPVSSTYVVETFRNHVDAMLVNPEWRDQVLVRPFGEVT